MVEIMQGELIYFWYYFSIQFDQIVWYWVLGMALVSLVSVFGKEKIHALFVKMRNTKMGAFGVVPASLLGIASPLCMYGTIPIAASFAEKGMAEDWIAAFCMSSILLNPQPGRLRLRPLPGYNASGWGQLIGNRPRRIFFVITKK
jgi:uncharacterized membrane protein YraQ (UPF0718 family)